MIDEYGTDRKTREKALKSGELIETLTSNWTEQAVGEISLWATQCDLWPGRSTRAEKTPLVFAFCKNAAFGGIAFFCDSKQQNRIPPTREFLLPTQELETGRYQLTSSKARFSTRAGL